MAIGRRPFSFFFYYNDQIGGESVHDIERLFLLASSSNTTPMDLELLRFSAEDQFEIKTGIIHKMHELDPRGGWMERGGDYPRNPHTRTGEEPMEKLGHLLNQLNEEGKESGAFEE